MNIVKFDKSEYLDVRNQLEFTWKKVYTEYQELCEHYYNKASTWQRIKAYMTPPRSLNMNHKYESLFEHAEPDWWKTLWKLWHDCFALVNNQSMLVSDSDYVYLNYYDAISYCRVRDYMLNKKL